MKYKTIHSENIAMVPVTQHGILSPWLERNNDQGSHYCNTCIHVASEPYNQSYTVSTHKYLYKSIY